ncbi:hypothetical protein CMV_006030 [Castanea mollissima]|uniref:Uncharacterized protein n=1 Tax=Castanea mollissima TaxID=60419 RepID=A0A8J4RW19_9ROSI|nr:hypothetical protein CMV_006030 [Castanea mollissima]
MEYASGVDLFQGCAMLGSSVRMRHATSSSNLYLELVTSCNASLMKQICHCECLEISDFGYSKGVEGLEIFAQCGCII